MTMSDVIIVLVYAGGMTGCQNAGIGFWKSTLWPFWLMWKFEISKAESAIEAARPLIVKQAEEALLKEMYKRASGLRTMGDRVLVKGFLVHFAREKRGIDLRKEG